MIALLAMQNSNWKSVSFALDRLGLAYEACTHRPDFNPSRVILPGVGHAQALDQEIRGKELDSYIKGLDIPFLGICLGMHVLFESSEEGSTPGLGIMSGHVERLPFRPCPHMGWTNSKEDPDQYFYYTHSYGVMSSEYAVLNAQAPQSFVAMVKKDNFTGVQFHPERSGETGQEFLKELLQ